MPSVYAVSDCLAHLPEWDRWPHAINEALSAGLPVVATRFCGVPDEILTGPGSALVDKLSAKSLGGALRTALDVGVAIGDRVRTEHLARLQPWSASAMASRLVVTLGAETSHPPNPA
jgi:glycosyltransferase involved in cell wall biosynthesis